MYVILTMLFCSIFALVASYLIVWIAFKAETPKRDTKENSPMSKTSTAPASTTELKVGVHTAQVTIQHGDVQDIVIETNNPDEFDICQNGDCLTVKEKDSSGGCISNVYQSNLGGRNTISVNGKTYTGNSVSIVNGKVFIDGKPAEDDKSSAPKDRNRLQITVPNNYSGELRLDGSGISCIELDAWVGPRLKLHSSGTAELVVGAVSVDELKCDLSGVTNINLNKGDCPRADISTSGRSTFVATYLDTATLDIDCSGISAVAIGSGSATKRTSAQASGNSKITCRGNYNNVSKDKSGLAEIRIS
ncbi:MAG: DUF2807 domain-containing protein [Candidatus Obscuribacterales bacterium]|nr:DUF2807 domain-containing protein [Candidatus Obscuribacterales bacterium]